MKLIRYQLKEEQEREEFSFRQKCIRDGTLRHIDIDWSSSSPKIMTVEVTDEVAILINLKYKVLK